MPINPVHARLRAMCLTAAVLAMAAGWATAEAAQSHQTAASAGGAVNVDTFKRAETDTYLAANVAQGALGRFVHVRELTPVDQQTVIRMNRDTLYSAAVFDLEAGDVTIVLPRSPGMGEGEDGRFQSVQVIDQDHYTKDVLYEGQRTFTRSGVGTRYIIALARTFVDPSDEADVAAAHATQDALDVRQAGKGAFEIPQWDQASLTKLRQALNAVTEASGGIDSARMFGDRDAVDPVQHLLGTAAGWGGNPREAAMYIGGVAPDNSGRTAYTMTMRGVPVDGFWSISVYNKDGFFEPNQANGGKGVYTINNVTAIPEPDGSVIVRFGGATDQPNTVPIVQGWNYLVRLYRPRAEILDGSWTAPPLEPAQ